MRDYTRIVESLMESEKAMKSYLRLEYVTEKEINELNESIELVHQAITKCRQLQKDNIFNSISMDMLDIHN